MALNEEFIDMMLLDDATDTDSGSSYFDMIDDSNYVRPDKLDACKNDSSNIKIWPIIHSGDIPKLISSDMEELNHKIDCLTLENHSLKEENKKLREENKRLERNLESIRLTELNHRILLQEEKKQSFFYRLFSWLFKRNNPYRKESNDGIVHKRV